MSRAQEDWNDAGPPGSDRAIDAGCRCPVIDNGHGKGYFGDGAKYGWVIVEGCPLHDASAKESK